MDRKTLTGFILIGAILLLWPSYLELVSPSEKTQEELVVPNQSLVDEYAQPDKPKANKPKTAINSAPTSSVEVDAGLFVTTINNSSGGSFASYNLKDHLKEGESFLNLIDINNSNNLTVSFIDQSGTVILLDDNWNLFSGASTKLNKENPSTTLSYYTFYKGKRIEKHITLNFNSYRMDVTVDLQNIKAESLDGKYTLTWDGGLPESEGKQDAMFMEGLVGQAGNIESFRVGSAGFFGSSDTSKIEKETKQYVGQSDFVGYRTKYFGMFFVPQKTDVVEITKYPAVNRAAVDVSVSQDINFDKNTLYLGPLDYGKVADLNVGLEEKILGWQWLSSVSWLVYSTMMLLYSFIPNYGLVVVLFAVLIKLITYPLMAKQLRSSKKMQEISPELNNIKLKYKNNPTLQQQKIAALFQENKINPLAGCLPLLIQMPVLMSVFMVFRNTIEFRGESFFLWISDLSSADTLLFIAGVPLNILPFLMAASMFYTMKLSSAGQPSGGDPAQEATQQMMKYMFPGMMFFLFYSFPSGLNLYYLCFNIMQILQQRIINSEKTSTLKK
jgi:YidC/Oxa1 family membrane protein insertase